MKKLSGLALISSVLAIRCVPLPHSAATSLNDRQSDAIRSQHQAGQFSGPNDSAATMPTVATAVACDDFLSKLKTPMQKDFIDVPENWDDPEHSAKIKVFYYWSTPASGAASLATPVVFYNGGPSADSHSSSAALDQTDFLKSAPFVFIDQRGTGCSDHYPTGFDDATAQRITKYGSRGIVRDSEAIRKHLYGEKRWRVFGQSFGGLIVHRYLEIAPEGIERAIAHGFTIDDPVDITTKRIQAQKRLSQLFFQQYPDDQDRLKAIRASIQPEQCWKNSSSSICGPNIVDGVFLLLGFQTAWKYLDSWINAIQPESVGPTQTAYLDRYALQLVMPEFAPTDLGGDVLSKMEIVPGYSDEDICNAVSARLQSLGDDPQSYDINECRLLTSVDSITHGFLGHVTGDPVSLATVSANLAAADAPDFYLFSGQKDGFVPYLAYTPEVAKLGSLVHYESFPNSGHEGFETEADVLKAVIEPRH